MILKSVPFRSVFKALVVLGLLVNAARAEEEAFLAADAPTAVFWDCAFPAGQDSSVPVDQKITCEDLGAQFFALNDKIVLRVSNPEAAELRIEVGNIAKSATEIRYTFVIHPAARFDAGDVRLRPIDLSMSANAKVSMGTLVAHLLIQVYEFRNDWTAKTDDAGELVIGMADGQPTPPPSKPGRLSKSPWYFEGSTTGSDSKQGTVQSSSFINTLATNYRTDRYRIELDLEGDYVVSSYPTPQGAIKGQLFAPSMKLTGVYSTSKRWNFAIISDLGVARALNMRHYSDVKAGAEYIVIPYRTNERNQLVVRMGAAYGYLDLLAPNERGNLIENLYGTFFQLAYVNSLLKGRAHFTVGGKVSNYKGAPDYAQFESDGKLDVDVGSKVTLQTKITYKYSKKTFMYPAAPDYANPAQEAFVESVAPGLNRTLSFGVYYHLGNQKRRFDERWSTAY